MYKKKMPPDQDLEGWKERGMANGQHVGNQVKGTRDDKGKNRKLGRVRFQFF